MDSSSDIVHHVGVVVDASADDAFAFMCDLEALGRWALGSMYTRPDGPEGVYTGTSIFDGGQSWIHIEVDPARRLVDYHVGTPDLRSPRIAARVIERGASAMITLTAWRDPAMDAARWERLCRSHELEILIIQAHCPQWVARRRQA